MKNFLRNFAVGAAIASAACSPQKPKPEVAPEEKAPVVAPAIDITTTATYEAAAAALKPAAVTPDIAQSAPVLKPSYPYSDEVKKKRHDENLKKVFHIYSGPITRSHMAFLSLGNVGSDIDLGNDLYTAGEKAMLRKRLLQAIEKYPDTATMYLDEGKGLNIDIFSELLKKHSVIDMVRYRLQRHQQIGADGSSVEQVRSLLDQAKIHGTSFDISAVGHMLDAYIDVSAQKLTKEIDGCDGDDNRMEEFVEMIQKAQEGEIPLDMQKMNAAAQRMIDLHKQKRTREPAKSAHDCIEDMLRLARQSGLQVSN